MPLDISQRWFAWAMPRLAQHYDNLLADRKQALLSGVGGTVVELGPGTGTNFRYYPPGVHWIGIEPNPYLHPHLHRAGEEARLRVDIRQGYAEQIDLADDSADVVVATAVLCSVTDQIQSLREIRRVLKPGGRFVFLEHVAARRGTSLRRIQRVVQPFWGCIADGCNPVRDTGEVIAGAGFKSINVESFKLPLGPVAPHIAGVAVA
jgi:SAM-dependent methyltransferase